MTRSARVCSRWRWIGSRQRSRDGTQPTRLAILIVEQNLDFVIGFASRFGLIERGHIIGEGSFADLDAAARIDRHLTI